MASHADQAKQSYQETKSKIAETADKVRSTVRKDIDSVRNDPDKQRQLIIVGVASALLGALLGGGGTWLALTRGDNKSRKKSGTTWT